MNRPSFGTESLLQDSTIRASLKYFAFIAAVAGLTSGMMLWLIEFMVDREWIDRPSEDFAAPVAVIVGAAVAFAGSIVAIALATITLNLQTKQEHRETLLAKIEVVKFASDRLDNILPAYLKVMNGFANLYYLIALNSDKLWDSESATTEGAIKIGFDFNGFLSEFNDKAKKLLDDIDSLYERLVASALNYEQARDVLNFDLCLLPDSESKVHFLSSTAL